MSEVSKTTIDNHHLSMNQSAYLSVEKEIEALRKKINVLMIKGDFGDELRALHSEIKLKREDLTMIVLDSCPAVAPPAETEEDMGGFLSKARGFMKRDKSER